MAAFYIFSIVLTIYSILLATAGTQDNPTTQTQNTMKNVKLNIRKLGVQGFSLIEMLVVIAVIGVIAAIAIPNIGAVNDNARKATAQRNAQSIASTVNAAVAAGETDDLLSSLQTPAIIDAISAGVSPGKGPFEGQQFIVPNIPASGDERVDLAKFLNWDGANRVMEYDPNAVW
jgi:type IV pilus assembly protein PilA